MPAFSPVHVKTLIPTFWEQAAKMVNGIQSEVTQSSDRAHTVSLTNWSIRAALDIIGIAGMGTEFDSLGNPDGEHKLLTEFYREVMSHSSPIFPWLGLLLTYINPRILLYLPEKRNQSLSKAFGDIRQRAGSIIEARKVKMQSEQSSKEGKDIITVALRSGMFSPEALLDHVMTSLVVGHISTSITFEWVMYELGQRPAMQARLREEIRAMLPGGMETANASDIEALPYLNAICSETLRFYPPLPFALRVAVRDTSILGTKVPKGTMIAYSPDAVNHDERFWGPDADVFDPERWMGPGKAANGGAANNFAFLTFSAGPRNCIGQWWERAELACLVAATIGRFEIELVNRDTAGFVEPVTAMISREGIYAHVKPIEGW
jgi:cytochrome P450